MSDFPYGSRAMRTSVPKNKLPAGSLPANVVKTLIQDEMVLDGNPRQNLASFVTTYMEPEAEDLMLDASRKNYIDIDEYPMTYEIQKRCVNMLADLFHSPAIENGNDGVGTSCIGSSEAIMLAGLAMKRKWKLKRQAQGKDTSNPNIIFGSNVQVCWHKMCMYFEVEGKEANVSPDCLVLTPERAKPLIDENTIGVCCILGSTFNGEYEDVKGMHEMLEKLNAETGWDVPIHVDGASGAFIAPFINPELEWDFRLPLVKSINASGHKFGLVYAGIGWILFREEEDLPQDLVFHVNYLGGDQASFTLNFSKGAGNVIGQYYNFLRLGRKGYTEVMTNGMENAEYLRKTLLNTGKFACVDKAHMPLVAFNLLDDSKYTVFDLQDKLKGKGWIVPAYTCSQGAENLAIMRVVVKENFTRDLAECLVKDFMEAITFFEQQHEIFTNPSVGGMVFGEDQDKINQALESAVKQMAKSPEKDSQPPLKRLRTMMSMELPAPPVLDQLRNLGGSISLGIDPSKRKNKKTTGVC